MQTSKTIGGILLISCTAIGGGVLALPTTTVMGGFIPSIIIFSICWFFMTLGALYLLEVNLYYTKEINLISMAKHTLGTSGKIIAWCTYMILLYALISLYLTGGGAWIIKLFPQYNLNLDLTIISLACITSLAIFAGTQAIDLLNRALSVGLGCSYLALIIICATKVDTSLIKSASIINILPSTPIIITTFGFAIIIPSLVHYFNRQKTQLIFVILTGSLIPLLVYVIWEYVMLGTLSVPGEYGLQALANKAADGTEVAHALEYVIGNPYINLAAIIFSVTALITSLIGVSLSLFHFLADGLQVAKHGKSALLLFLLTFTPPIIIVIFFPLGFNKILSFGGVFVAILLGIIPISMTYMLRYKLHLSTKADIIVPAGKPLLLITLLFFLYVIGIEIITYF